MKDRSLKIVIWLAYLLCAGGVNAGDMPRHILALYNSGTGQTPMRNHVHHNAEVILNHLGCIVDYWDIAQGLPDAQAMEKYRGVITWFYSNAMPDPEAYLDWATAQVNAGTKYVILGDIGAFQNTTDSRQTPRSAINAFTSKLGFKVGEQNWTADVTKIALVDKDAEMVEFERALTYELSNYERYRTTDPNSRVYLRLRRRDIPGSESDMVFTTPFGGFAAAGYVIHENDETARIKWRLNPFRFFSEAFGLAETPRPDVTTLNGSRIWCSHIDGDAFNSVSEINPDKRCSEIIFERVLKKYRWPFSVSVVIAEIQGDRKLIDIAREIYQLDWVEAASHSYSHPFYWADDSEDKAEYARRHLPVPGYSFDVATEIHGSVQYINDKLLPPGKKVKQFFWTGNCEPTEEALRLCEQENILNINGGDSVFDRSAPSYTSLAPISVRVGEYRQFYAPNANENIYTNKWQGPYYGYRRVLETFDNTESPVRIKPINVYFHFYIGEKWAALNSLAQVLQTTTRQSVAPMFVSEYTIIARDFFKTKIREQAAGVWEIADYGQCTTIRFDLPDRYPDLQKSTNVQGFLRHQGALYVHLAQASRAVIVLTARQPQVPYLAQGSHRVTKLKMTRTEVSFETTGYGRGYFRFANLEGNRHYRITTDDAAFQATSDANGVMEFHFDMNGRTTVHVESM